MAMAATPPTASPTRGLNAAHTHPIPIVPSGVSPFEQLAHRHHRPRLSRSDQQQQGLRRGVERGTPEPDPDDHGRQDEVCRRDGGRQKQGTEQRRRHPGDPL